MGDLNRDFDGQFVFSPQHCTPDVSSVGQGCSPIDDDVLLPLKNLVCSNLTGVTVEPEELQLL
jgi:hypothetical protein